jgi:hypothetical protein
MHYVEIAMREMPEPPTPAFVKIAGKPCTEAVSSLFARRVRRKPMAILSRFEAQKHLRPDSESRFLAIKIFS